MAAWGDELREARKGIMLHYDASLNDKGSVAWLKDDRCRVSYNWITLDNGNIVEIAPPKARAWHAGVCRWGNPESGFKKEKYKDANSAFYGLSIAATVGDETYPHQLRSIVAMCKTLFLDHRWSLQDEAWRIVGHDTESWYRDKEKWYRKIDPIGPNKNRPVLDPAVVRRLIAQEGLPSG